MHFEIDILPVIFIEGFEDFDFGLERARCFIRFQHFTQIVIVGLQNILDLGSDLISLLL